MRWGLTCCAIAILGVMTLATSRALAVRSVFDNGALLADPWFVATLCDAYCGFLLFWLWAAWREANWLRAGVWFVLVMSLGNFAMAGYVLWAVWRLPEGATVADLLQRPAVRSRAVA